LGMVPRIADVLEFIPGARSPLPEMQRLEVNLREYDNLLEREEVVV